VEKYERPNLCNLIPVLTLLGFPVHHSGSVRMKVLVACEFSGIVRDAFIARGHDAMSCDLLPTEKPGPHYQGDVFDIINDGWDLMIAHPPCTYLSYVATKYWNEPDRWKKRLDALHFFGQLWAASVERICLENPMGCASPTIAKFSQVIQPYYFGDREQKRTCLWLKNLPPLIHCKSDNDLFMERTHREKPEPYAYTKSGKPLYFEEYMKFSDDRSSIRSRTFPGIANAMADQWGNL
jgi:hypothetical protein